MQDVFLALMKRPEGLSGDAEHLKAWLIRVAINKGKDFRKSSKRKAVELKDVYAYSLDKEESDVMHRIRLLPPFDRSIIYLYYYESYSVEEIAQNLKVKAGTVYVRLKRAREKLKDLLVDGS